eukprot:3040862-Pyramimonas_sp.AAC.1
MEPPGGAPGLLAPPHRVRSCPAAAKLHLQRGTAAQVAAQAGPCVTRAVERRGASHPLGHLQPSLWSS